MMESELNESNEKPCALLVGGHSANTACACRPGDRMKRRGLLIALLACGAIKPFAVTAQKPRRIGIVQGPNGVFRRDKWAGLAFVATMKELGYQEGRDWVLDVREWEKPEEVPGLVHELLRAEVEVIVASAPPSIMGARSVTDRVPIVMAFSADPVATGLVRSLNRPGGNLTGLSWDHGFETVLKQLELMREAIPKIRRAAVLWDATDTAHPIYAKYFDQAAQRIGFPLLSLGVRAPSDFPAAFDKLRAENAHALIILPSAQLILPHRLELMKLVRQHRVPTLAGPIHWDFPGALLIWAPSQAHVPHRVAVFVDRILKGAKPGDLPIEQPTKYEFHVDLRVARDLGIAIPRSVLVQADKIIE
jgi:putative ABC transport system substrate-binding protein